MIITLIGLGLLIVGIILAIVNAKVYFENWKVHDGIEWIKFPALFLAQL